MSEAYRVELFGPADAEKVCGLFREVYGDAYPIKSVYDPAHLIAESQGGMYFPFVVRTPDGRVIAYGALNQTTPYGGIYEFVQGLVSPAFQGAGLGRLLFEFVGHYLPTLPGAEVYFGEAVCNHVHSQKAGYLIKTIETGIEVDLMPGDTYEKGDAVPGRVAALDMFRTFVSKPHRVHIPEIYEDIIRYIYGGLDDARTLVLSKGVPDLNRATEISARVFDLAGVARIAVPMAGPDFADRFDREEHLLVERKIKVFQVWLCLAQPWVGEIVGMLRMKGYFFAGIFPRWFDQDALLMQRIVGQPNWDEISLYSRRAEEIRKAVYEDWKAVSRVSAGIE